MPVHPSSSSRSWPSLIRISASVSISASLVTDCPSRRDIDSNPASHCLVSSSPTQHKRTHAYTHSTRLLTCVCPLGLFRQLQPQPCSRSLTVRGTRRLLRPLQVFFRVGYPEVPFPPNPVPSAESGAGLVLLRAVCALAALLALAVARAGAGAASTGRVA